MGVSWCYNKFYFQFHRKTFFFFSKKHIWNFLKIPRSQNFQLTPIMLSPRLLLTFETFTLLLNLALFSEAMENSLQMNICAPHPSKPQIKRCVCLFQSNFYIIEILISESVSNSIYVLECKQGLFWQISTGQQYADMSLISPYTWAKDIFSPRLAQNLVVEVDRGIDHHSTM